MRGNQEVSEAVGKVVILGHHRARDSSRVAFASLEYDAKNFIPSEPTSRDSERESQYPLLYSSLTALFAATIPGKASSVISVGI